MADPMPPSLLLFQPYESDIFVGLDFRGKVAECMAAAESHKPARTEIVLDWPLHSGAARSIVPVEPEIIMEIPAHAARKIPNPNKGAL
jgi:hypothetical protein